jgi:hypothetical protein
MHDKGPEAYNNNLAEDYRGTEQDHWTNKEEKRVIQEIETPAAIQLNKKFHGGEVPRNSHKIPKRGKTKMSSSTSTKTRKEAKKEKK